jgi:ABC-type arginine transport system ATPase subunit
MTRKKEVIKGFRFKKHVRIGANDALEDMNFLKECFVDTGERDILLDVKNPECVVLGRTGSGKTALLEMLNQHGHRVVRLSPEGLALSYLSNNQALKFFMEVGIDMDLFFRVLWRHILAVEIIKEHFDITNSSKANNLICTDPLRLDTMLNAVS